jgi:hypothetical protein
MIGRCHCGDVTFALSRGPSDINDCQCNHCQKRGVLWSYFDRSEVTFTGKTASYIWGDREIVFHFCPRCGCTSHWIAVDPEYSRVGLNVRLLEPEDWRSVPVRRSPGPR